MKRFIASLIVLVLLAAAVFAVGYVPLRLRAGHTGVLYSKTSGWYPEAIEPGRFLWRWELLIPTNTTLHHFPGDSHTVELRSSALLPSAEVYAPMLDGATSLEQNVRLRVRFRFLPEALVRNAPRGLQEGTLDNWYADLEDEIRSSAQVFLGTIITDLAEREDLHLPASDVADRLQERLQDRFRDLEVLSVVVETLDLPDPQLYRLARETYRNVHAAREEALLEAAQALAGTQAATDQQVATLERYGRVFSDYPILLEYLEITARTGRDPLSIESIPTVPVVPD